MIRINNPYLFPTIEETTIRVNPPTRGADWEEGIFDSIKENIKKYLLSEQGRICPYCGLKIPKRGYFPPVEHIAPKKMHYRFMFEPKNLIITCTTCNTYKRDKETLTNPATPIYPTRGDDFLIVQPYFDDYFQHIALVCDIFLKALTDKGSKTIDYCKLDELALAEERMEQIKINQEEVHKKLVLQVAKENDLNIKQQIIRFIEQHS